MIFTAPGRLHVRTALRRGGEQPAAAPSGEKVKLTVLTHWGEESLAKPMKAKLDEYMAANPNVEIEYQAVTFDQLLTKITTAAPWRQPGHLPLLQPVDAGLRRGRMLDVPPAAVLEDIQANYSPGTQSAVSYNDQMWGYPTELNTYQLLYNKKMLQEAGIENRRLTLEELVDAACKLAVKNPDGTLDRAGGAAHRLGSGVVHPFLSLLGPSNGQYLSEDRPRPCSIAPKALQVLNLYMDMIANQ